MNPRVAVASIVGVVGAVVIASSACDGTDVAPKPDEAAVGDAQADTSGETNDGAPGADGGSLPSARDLFADDALWVPVAGTACFEAAEARTRFPKRVWTPCGGGCRLAPTGPPFAERFVASYVTATGGWIAGETYVLLELKSDVGFVAHLSRLSDDETLAAVLDRAPSFDCYLPLWGGSSPLLFAMSNKAGNANRYGRAPTDLGKPIAWHPEDVPDPGGFERFSFDLGYGFGTGGGPALTLAPPDAGTLYLTGGGERAHGYGKQVVWSNSRAAAIRSWAPDTNAVDLIATTGERHALSVRLSEDRLVWISGNHDLDTYRDVRWQWSPRATTNAGIDIHDGPTLPIIAGLIDLQVGGEWAAVNGCSGPRDASLCKVHVWHVTTGESWTVPARAAGRRFSRVLAISPTELVLGETGFANDEAFYFDTLVRIELASLPAITSTWGK
jgi:hypothetical protein